VRGPFDDLDPGAPAGGPEPESPPPAVSPSPFGGREPERSLEPGVLRVLARGAARLCPRCGSGHLFERWFEIRERCPRCGLPLEREEGGFLGAMVLSYAASAAVLVALIVVWLIVDLPDLHVGALTAAAIAVAAIVPLAFWPFSKTLWAAVDHLVHRGHGDAGP
jgi:uncharacterized protein (DUF983 family)